MKKKVTYEYEIYFYFMGLQFQAFKKTESRLPLYWEPVPYHNTWWSVFILKASGGVTSFHVSYVYHQLLVSIYSVECSFCYCYFGD